jgi:hypothetical protein
VQFSAETACIGDSPG